MVAREVGTAVELAVAVVDVGLAVEITGEITGEVVGRMLSAYCSKMILAKRAGERTTCEQTR